MRSLKYEMATIGLNNIDIISAGHFVGTPGEQI